jgi:hypothetical protein
LDSAADTPSAAEEADKQEKPGSRAPEEAGEGAARKPNSAGTALPSDKRISHKNILLLMLENMQEIRDYFSISKNHARLSFWMAIVNCVAGLVLLGLAVNCALTAAKPDAAILPAAAGAVAEAFAGTSLVVHKKSLTQLNHYYDALHENEMFLSTVQLIGSLSPDRQDDVYIEVIRNELRVRYETALIQAARNKADPEETEKPSEPEKPKDGEAKK